MRHKWLVMVVFAVTVVPAAADDLLCNFAVGGPSRLSRESDPRNFRVVTGPESTKFESALQRARRVADIPPQVNFTIIDMPVENAFMFANGRGFFTLPMVARHNEDQLAAVIGHEADHYLERHGKNQLKRHIKWNVAQGAVLATTGGALQSGLLVGTLLASVFHRAHKSRGYEYDADQFGCLVALAAGYDLYQYAGLMDEFERRHGSPGGLVGRNAASHPPSRNRAQLVRELADSAPRANQATQPSAAVADRSQPRPQGNGKPTVALRRINLEGSSYTSYEHAKQLITAELSKYVTVTERSENARFHLDLSGNIAIAPSQGARSVFTSEFDIQVVGGNFAGRASFAGSLVGQDGTVYAASSKPSDESAKRISGLSARYGRWQPIAVQTQGYSSPELIVLQKLIEKGIEAWAADLVSRHLDQISQPTGLPTGSATHGVEQVYPIREPTHSFPVDPGKTVGVGKAYRILEEGQPVGTVAVVLVTNGIAFCYVLEGQGPSSKTKTHIP